MAYCTVKWVSADVPFPGDQCSKFLRFTEEKTTSLGWGGEDETEGTDGRLTGTNGLGHPRTTLIQTACFSPPVWRQVLGGPFTHTEVDWCRFTSGVTAQGSTPCAHMAAHCS